LRQVDNLLGAQDFTGFGAFAEASRQVQRSSAVSTLDGNRFTDIDSDAHQKRFRRICLRLRPKPVLQRKSRPYRRARRAEHRKGFVATQLHQATAMHAHDGASQCGEPGCEFGAGLITMFRGITRVSPDVSYQEDAQIRRRLSPRRRRHWGRTPLRADLFGRGSVHGAEYPPIREKWPPGGTRSICQKTAAFGVAIQRSPADV
jgi:hypothetical protein